MRWQGRAALLLVASTLAGCGREAGTNDATPPAASPASDPLVEAPPATGMPAPTIARSVQRAVAGWQFDLDAATASDATRIDVLVRTATAGAAPRRLVLAFDGALVDAFATDLDGDASPELLLWIMASGSLAEADVHGWRFDASGEATPLPLPPLDDDAAVGWRGRDQFGVQGDALVRSFPLYRDDDDNAHPTSGFVRVIRYRLDADGLSVSDTTMEPVDGTPQADVLAR